MLSVDSKSTLHSLAAASTHLASGNPLKSMFHLLKCTPKLCCRNPFLNQSHDLSLSHSYNRLHSPSKCLEWPMSSLNFNSSNNNSSRQCSLIRCANSPGFPLLATNSHGSEELVTSSHSTSKIAACLVCTAGNAAGTFHMARAKDGIPAGIVDPAVTRIILTASHRCSPKSLKTTGDNTIWPTSPATTIFLRTVSLIATHAAHTAARRPADGQLRAINHAASQEDSLLCCAPQDLSKPSSNSNNNSSSRHLNLHLANNLASRFLQLHLRALTTLHRNKLLSRLSKNSQRSSRRRESSMQAGFQRLKLKQRSMQRVPLTANSECI